MGTSPPQPEPAGGRAAAPPIPIQLAHLPTLGGLAVPWITATTPDGRHRLGAIDQVRSRQCLTHRLCQVCGKPHQGRIVFAMRERDLARMISPEPGMDPVCAAYTSTACPMLAGTMSHHASHASSMFAGIAISGGDPVGLRPGRPAEPWHYLWASGYRPITDPDTLMPAALLIPEQILKVRPIGGPR
ncbi:hypothetical protein [Catellatospora chokoriensis]|uniref:Uncharacterized protein n=1 Tax=Catellatospora chokoriensis TaxID=310353 RepID=A0A8J3JRM1_9ACTN|nr:hypothetical protein [Catellatospora chokoriensis]GIF89822.1 hypothetical protein Cch02nite_32660 [Catellatospora chokoriensis]